MRSTRIIQGIDSHTAGCPLRLITSGVGPLPGRTIVEKRAALMARDEFRGLVMFEPRGSFNLPAAVLVEACSEDADIGMIIMEPDSYPPMCGHCAIATATIAVEAGYVRAVEGETVVRLDTPAGVVPARVHVEGGRAVAVTLSMPESFLYRDEVRLETRSFGRVTGRIAYGGDFYLIVDAADLGLDLLPEEAWRLVQAGAELREAVQNVPVQHPLLPHVNSLYQVQLAGPARTPAGDARNVVICPPTVIDRSPCGTGTAARMAMLAGLGRMGPGDTLRHEGILDTVFQGEILERIDVGGFQGIRCTVTGSAWLTGTFNFFLDPDDPFPSGLRLTGV
jgi:proline racemase